MKKAIAAILVTILASAGYVVLDKASADKIDLMASQISSQQAVINRLETALIPSDTTTKRPADPLEMHTGNTLACYPSEGTVVQAYVLDLSRIPDDTTTTTITTTTTTTTTTTRLYTTVPVATTRPATTRGVYAQAEGPTSKTNTVPTYSMSEEDIIPTTPPTTYSVFRSADYYFNTNRYYYYHLRTDVQIQNFYCVMNDKTMTGVPVFDVSLSGKVDPAYAGRQIVVWFGDSHVDVERATATIQANGSFRVSSELTLANPAVIPLSQIRID